MRICVINTGGTISCVGEPLAPMPSARFADAARQVLGPALDAALSGVALHFDTGLRFDSGSGMLDSTDLRPSDWCRIARRVLELYADHDAFVVLHGTDTMEYSGTALALLLNAPDALGLPRACLSKPVILTGAQLPLFRETPDGLVLNAGSDALANLTGALEVARLRLPEVGLFFDGRLLRGSRALKFSTTRFAGFDSPHLAPLAERGIGIRMGAARPLPGPAAPELALDTPEARTLALARLDRMAARIDGQRIVQIPAVPADHRASAPLLAQMVRAALEDGATGLVLEGFGAGNMPQGAGALEQALRAARVPVLIASRAVAGQVGAFDYAAGAWIAQTGAIAAGDMTPVAALAKLMILNADPDTPDLRAMLPRSLAGECTAPDRIGDALWPGQVIAATDAPLRLENDPARGPRLMCDGAVLWQAPGAGRLEMRGDRLALIAPDGATAWHSAPQPGGVPILTAQGLLLVDPARRAAPVIALAC